ncbi:MAG: ATP-binding protein [Thermoplasmata archaeon]|nr:ATP-binding protein [Thermoplasmata archaeon]
MRITKSEKTTEEKAFLDAEEGFDISDIGTTRDIIIPFDPLKRVIGQNEAIELASIAASQHRHLLLVGPPGTGKSMIAQALALHLPIPTEEIRVVHNPENPERPFVQLLERDQVLQDVEQQELSTGELIDPMAAPVNVAERLGYKCMNCGTYSNPKERICTKCSRPKSSNVAQSTNNPFGDILGGIMEVTLGQQDHNERVTTTRKRYGKEEVVVYERAGEMIMVLDQKTLEKRREMEKITPSKVIVPLDRTPFVLSTGASVTELLGDVRHDPYGSHPHLGTPPFERVVSGAIHEAHQGVLFIDELPHLGFHQRHILTAMQERRFPISGRNPQSAGASVRVDNVPCNFIFVGACNIQDLEYVLSPLRSRIIGSGYEVLVEVAMPDNPINRAKLAQFAAQEIAMDGRIPQATGETVLAIIEEAKNRAMKIDKVNKSFTLRLRELGGLIRTAGDIAVGQEAKHIEPKHVKQALKRSKTIEEQVKEKYGSYTRGVASDMTGAQKHSSPYHYWNQDFYDDKTGYE